MIQIHLPKGRFGMLSYFLHRLLWETLEFTHLRSEPCQCCSVAPAGHGSLGLFVNPFLPSAVSLALGPGLAGTSVLPPIIKVGYLGHVMWSLSIFVHDIYFE